MLSRLSLSILRSRNSRLVQLPKTDILFENEYQEQVEETSSSQQEYYSDEDNNQDNNDDGPQGGRLMPVIEIIKQFIPRVVSQV